MKPWQDYPDQYRAAVLRAYSAGRHDVQFDYSTAAYSFRTRAVWMQRDIAAQQDAPEDLRAACTAVRWEGPRLNSGGTCTLTGTTAPRPGLTDDDILKAMKGGQNE